MTTGISTTIVRHLDQPSDFKVFRAIRLEALRLEPEAFASRVEDWENLADREWQARLSANPVFVAFQNAQPVGIMGLMRQAPSKMRHRATIIMVYLRQSERGQGLANALLDSLFEHARKNGVRQVELAVSAENLAAIRFYERAGFREIGRIPGAFLDQGREIDEIMMAKRTET